MMMDSWDFQPGDTGDNAIGGGGGGGISRKRSRSSTPTPKANSNANGIGNSGNGDNTIQDDPSPTSAALAIRILDPVQRNAAINELLRASATNYALEGDQILQALVEVVFQCLNWEEDAVLEAPVIFKPTQAWTVPPTQQAKQWASHCQQCFSNQIMIDPLKLKCIEAVVVILRNLSYAAANVRLLVFSPDVIAILVGCLYEGSFSSSPANLTDSTAPEPSALALSAIHTLLNMAPHLDVTGQKLYCDKLFFSPKNDDAPLMPNPSSFGLAADSIWGFGSLWLAKRLDTKEDVVTDISKRDLLDLTNSSDFLVQVWSIFPALSSVLMDPKSPRTLLLPTLELVQEFVNHATAAAAQQPVVEDALNGDGNDHHDDDIPSARSILIHMPDDILERFIDLLYIPRLGPDSLSYEDPTVNIVTRVNFFKLLMTYEANVDTDTRDRSLDVLVPLLELDSPRMAVRIGLHQTTGRMRTRLYDALVPILAGGSGRNDSSGLGSQMLKELAKAPNGENKIGLDYIEGRLMEMAAREPRASMLALAHLYAAAPPAVADGEGGESEAVATDAQVDQI